jgi:multiple sugar transport system permease protein/raffinose/stachyose/melibiose transport system permease protein
MKKVLGSKLAIALFCLPGILLFVVFVLYPLYNVVVYSFQSYDGIAPGKFVGLKNYLRLWGEPAFWDANGRSLYLCAVTMFVDTVLVTIFTLIIVGLRPWIQKAYKIAFLLPFVLSISVISQMWLAIYHPEWGILNSILKAVGLGQFAQGWLLNPDISMLCVGFVGMWWIFGMQLLLIYTGYRSIPENYFEAAQIDGASYFQSSVKIALPLLTNIIRLSLTMTAVGGLYTFPQVYIMTKGGPGASTETVMMYMYKQVFSNQRFGLGSAIAVIAILETCAVLVAVTMLTRRESIQY